MFELERPVDGATGIEQGTSLLVTGSAQDSRGVVYDILSEAFDDADERVVVVATDRNAKQVVSELRSRTPAFEPGAVGIVDTTAQAPPLDGIVVETIGSAGDLTGISLATAKLVRQLGGEQTPIRLGLVSISTILMYADVQTVFRFLHVFTSRVNSAGWLGAFALDPGMHDPQTVSTIRAAFDAELLADENGITARGNGFVRE